jgi:hypothetical protein
MPSAADVRPEKWSNITILFDNGEYSVISGMYEQTNIALGERWNGGSGNPLGFPSSSGHAVWHVVPAFLELPILHGLLDELSRHPNSQAPERAAAILSELGRLRAT